MAVFLVRHGDAGARSDWELADDLRPLSAKGARQARGLVGAFDGQPIEHVLSSPFLRCVQTVEPLAVAHGLAVRADDALGEEADRDAVVALLKRVAADGPTALCTHGNIVPIVLDHLKRKGVRFVDPPHRWEKGSTWVLATCKGKVVEASYLPPPGTEVGPAPQEGGGGGTR